MFKKMLRILKKDAQVTTRDALLLYIIVVPILLAGAIVLFAPGVTESNAKIALLESDDAAYIEYMENYADVEIFSSLDELERRINKRDDIAGLVKVNGGHEIVIQGNEPEDTIEYAKLLNSFHTLGLNRDNTTAEILSFENKVPPLKTNLVNILILMISMLSGMIISLGIVEEKSDNTINAINVSPVSQNAFIFGKSLLGGTAAMVSIVLTIIITGYYDINWIFILLAGLTSLILSFVIGFLQGISSEDVIEAAAGVKMVMLPMAGSIAGYELLSDKWQWTMYWSPFYWSYKANFMILSKSSEWGTILLSVGMVFIISFAIYLLFIPKIRKGLS